MTNPWLDIPAFDYEAHMNSANVDQLTFLAQAFKQALHEHDPRRVALLGCATGNGLEHVENADSERVTAVDINPEYLEILRRRYAGRISGLEIVNADLESCAFPASTFTLVFAGLVFEYANPAGLLPAIKDWLCPDGVLVSLLQLATEQVAPISATPYKSLLALERIMKLYTPQAFSDMAVAAGLQPIDSQTITLPSGKSFSISSFRKQG